MALGAGTCIDHPALGLDVTGSGQQWNVSLGNRCALTVRCGKACFLNRVQPEAPELDDRSRWQAIEELLSAGPSIRHVSCVEKEPFENELLLKQILRKYHALPKARRPQAIGAITAGLQLRKSDWLGAEIGPLSWLLVSLDGLPATHYRGAELWEPAFSGLLHVKRRGGAVACGVNTVLTGQNLESVLGLGKLLVESGIDYWGVSPWMDVDDGQMVSQLSFEQIGEMYERLSSHFQGQSIRIVFEMPPDMFALISHLDPYRVTQERWRLEYHVPGSPVVAATINADPGWWFRLRFDGQILDTADLHTVGLLEGRYGRYWPGRIIQLVESADARRDTQRPSDAAFVP